MASPYFLLCVGIYFFVLLIGLYLIYSPLSGNILIIYFEIAGTPKPLQRHRHFGRRTYDPSRKDKKQFYLLAAQYKPDVPITKAIRLGVVFYFNRPKSHYRTGKFSYLLKDDAPTYHTKTPDVDNLAKFVADSFNTYFYKDDSQIIEMKAEKYYVSQGEQARTEVMIDEI